MGFCGILYGQSGTGKTSSLRNLPKDKVFLIEAINKELPFRGEFKYTYVSDSVDSILNALNKMPCKVAIIDDTTFIMVNEFMRKHNKTSDQFSLYNNIADMMMKLIWGIKSLPKDVRVYIVMHETETDSGRLKLKTIGKLLDDKAPIEAQVTTILRTQTDGKKYWISTHNSGYDLVKTPIGMFEVDEVPNDLLLVDDSICDFYGIEKIEREEKEGKK